MEKNKIPIWENYDRYLPETEFLLGNLLAISDRDYQVRVWANQLGPEVDCYNETLYSFESSIDCFKSLIREKKIQLSAKQIKAVIRIFAMWFCFERKLEKEKIPEEWIDREMYIIDHPYWDKMRRQAQYALHLLKRGCDQRK